MTEIDAPLQQDTALLPSMLTCTPDPLFVSTQAKRETGKLALMIGVTFPPLRNRRLDDSSWSYGPDGTGGGAISPDASAQVWCQKIVVNIPCGEAATDLARIFDTQDLNPVVAQLPQWNARKDLIGNVASFTFTPSRPPYHFTGTNYITAVIDKIPINAEPGTATVTITETTSSTSASAGFADRVAYREAPKVTTEFYFYDLHPREAAIGRGEIPVLEWKGNTSNTDFTVYWSDGVELCSEVLEPSAEAWFPRRNIPRNSTTFLVMAEHRPPGQTTTIRRHLTTTVEVIDPDIIANEIRAKDNIIIAAGKRLKTDNIERVSGNVDLTILGNALVTGDMTANGWLWSRTDVWADNAVKGSEFGRRSGSGQIQVPGGVNAGSGGVSTSGAVSTSGSVTAGHISASGDITVAADRTLKANRIGRTSGSGVIKFGDNLELDYGLTAAGDVSAHGKRLVGIGDEIALKNYSNNSGPYYLYCLSGGSWHGGSSGSPYIVGNRSNSYNNSNWTIIGVWDTAAADDSADSTTEPDA